jgi:hypothetical protein
MQLLAPTVPVAPNQLIHSETTLTHPMQLPTVPVAPNQLIHSETTLHPPKAHLSLQALQGCGWQQHLLLMACSLIPSVSQSGLMR